MYIIYTIYIVMEKIHLIHRWNMSNFQVRDKVAQTLQVQGSHSCTVKGTAGPVQGDLPVSSGQALPIEGAWLSRNLLLLLAQLLRHELF